MKYEPPSFSVCGNLRRRLSFLRAQARRLCYTVIKATFSTQERSSGQSIGPQFARHEYWRSGKPGDLPQGGSDPWVTQAKPWVTQAICGVTQGKTRRDPRVGIAQAALFATKQRKNRGPPSKVYRGVTSTEESAVRTQLLHWQPCLEKRKGERIEAIWRSRTGNSLGDIHPTHLQPMRKREKAAFEACAERQRSRPLTLRPSHSLGLGSGWVLHGERAPAGSGIIVRDTFFAQSCQGRRTQI
jgi:hypothetical protein